MKFPKLDDTLLSHYQALYYPQRLSGRSRFSDEGMRVAMRHLDRMLGRPALISDLNDETMSIVLDQFSKETWRGRKRSVPTINKLYVYISAIWNFLHRKGITKTGPTLRKIPEPETTPRAWTAEELAAVWSACNSEPGMVGAMLAKDFWGCLVRILWDSGERVGAVFSLQWEDVNFSTGRVNFKAIYRKGRRKPNMVRLAPDTLAYLERIRRPSGLVLPWPYSVSMLFRRYKTILRSVGLEASRSTMFHCLRRSVASHAENAGMDATRLLGHSSRQVTQRYLDPRIVRRIEAVDVLFRPDAVNQ